MIYQEKFYFKKSTTSNSAASVVWLCYKNKLWSQHRMKKC